MKVTQMWIVLIWILIRMLVSCVPSLFTRVQWKKKSFFFLRIGMKIGLGWYAARFSFLLSSCTARCSERLRYCLTRFIKCFKGLFRQKTLNIFAWNFRHVISTTRGPFLFLSEKKKKKTKKKNFFHRTLSFTIAAL